MMPRFLCGIEQCFPITRAPRLSPRAMSFLYKPLAEDEIRLLTVKTRNGATVSTELHTYPRKAAPPYDAVSYAWGDDTSTTSMTCNGLSLMVRTTLFEALPHIHDSRPDPRTRPLWIDAICLNQNDDHEKAVHVLCMHEIFEIASRTLIWLGKAENDSDLAMDNIESLTQKLLLVKDPESLDVTQLLARNDLPPETDTVWEAIQALGMRSWFFRLWTLQEIVLSQEPVLLCGDKSMSWATLAALHDAGTQAQLSPIIAVEAVDEASYKNCDAVISHVEFMRKWTKSHSLDLSVLLTFSANRGYTIPVDRIWALLGLMDKRYRQLILHEGLVNYGKTAVHNYHETFLGIMKFHIKHNTSIALQLIEGSLRTSRNPLLPSWCPDWHTDTGNISLLLWAESFVGFPGGNPHQIKPFMQVDHDASLELCGLVMDAVDRVTMSAGQRMHMYENHTWLDECLNIINEFDFVQYDVYAESFVVDPVATNYPIGELISEERRVYMRMEEILEDVLYPPKALKPAAGNIMRCNGRKFFRTEAGRFGIGPPDLKKDDILCAMYGARTLWALRPCEASEKARNQVESSQRDDQQQTFELVGCAYTPSLLSGQAWVGTSCESMRRFKLR